jgi:murein DD-endopeptidase MepM/ murein hydrolase activator NlpD
VNSPVGPRSCLGCSGYHGGTDYNTPMRTPVRATYNGEVVRSHYSDSFGNAIIIDHGNGKIKDQKVYTLYGHAEELLVKAGDTVRAGQLIMRSGNSGVNTEGKQHSIHLHYEVISTSHYYGSRGFYSEKEGFRFGSGALSGLID